MNRENNVDRGKEAGEKMIFIILLLLFLTLCVSGKVVVNVTQTFYQAEENQNITLEWTFSTRRDTSLRSISTIIQLFNKKRKSVLFELREGVESPESQDPQFAGRVQWDKDFLTEGRLTVHVSRLRTNDSGFYVCDILTPDGSNSRRCWLSVTAAEELEPQRPTESPQAEILRRLWLIVGHSAALLILFFVTMACVVLIRTKRRTHIAAMQMESLSERQTIRTYMSPEKMIFLILQLLFLTSCVSGTFVVNVTQASYQAEENQNITLEWTFSTRRDTSLRSVSTLCFLFTEIRTFVLFHLHQGVESPESQDPQFKGRVQWDKDVLREGRLTLHVSRLRTNDSGFYVCDILVRSEGSNSRRCWLNVTAAEFKPEGTTESQQPKSGRNYWIFIAAAAAAVMGIIATKDETFQFRDSPQLKTYCDVIHLYMEWRRGRIREQPITTMNTLLETIPTTPTPAALHDVSSLRASPCDHTRYAFAATVAS
ncbi:hypothetical protein NQZ68_018109 [Dissostichus eleginoides]|nr:hypothetical protein NQZ68_018109 [Dissostichus eleginoides]